MDKHILVPLDGSTWAERALPLAATLAHAAGAPLTLLHVLVYPAEHEAAAARELLEPTAAALRARGLAVHCRLEPAASPAAIPAAILQAAAAAPAELMVLSSHGRAGAGRWLYGQVAEALLQQAPLPLLLVPLTCSLRWPSTRPPRLLVPLDGSALAEEALGPAARWAAALGAELVLLQVVEPPLHPPDGAPGLAADLTPALEGARAYLREVATRLRAAGQVVEVHTPLGSPGGRISALAREQGVDLVVLSTHGRGARAELVLGRVALATLQQAGLPLLLVRPAAVRLPSAEDAASLGGEGQSPAVTLRLSGEELRLVELGLERLLQGEHPAEPITDLLERLRHAGAARHAPAAPVGQAG